MSLPSDQAPSANGSIGSSALSALVQAASWLAFGFSFGLGIWLAHPLAEKILG